MILLCRETSSCALSVVSTWRSPQEWPKNLKNAHSTKLCSLFHSHVMKYDLPPRCIRENITSEQNFRDRKKLFFLQQVFRICL